MPLLARVYPNGVADVNHFHAAGGMEFLIRELLGAGLLHEDVKTVWGSGPRRLYARAPTLDADGNVAWSRAPTKSRRREGAAPVSRPFSPEGGLKLLDRQSRPRGDQDLGGEARAPGDRGAGAVFHSQEELSQALPRPASSNRDFVAVVRFQGPRANGMPELHKLTPTLGVLQDRGFKVALVTDGRMSGASGKVPAAIHVTPEAVDGGAIARIRDGDIIRLDAPRGRLQVLVDAAEFAAREPATADLSANDYRPRARAVPDVPGERPARRTRRRRALTTKAGAVPALPLLAGGLFRRTGFSETRPNQCVCPVVFTTLTFVPRIALADRAAGRGEDRRR